MKQTLNLTAGAKAALAFAAPAVATLDVRHYLTGALLTSHKGHLAAVGTDGHFMAIAGASIDMPTAWADVILPTVLAKSFRPLKANTPTGIACCNRKASITSPLSLWALILKSRLCKGLKTALKLAGKKGAESLPFMRFHMLAFGGQPNSARLEYETVADDCSVVEFHAVVMRARV